MECALSWSINSGELLHPLWKPFHPLDNIIYDNYHWRKHSWNITQFSFFRSGLFFFRRFEAVWHVRPVTKAKDEWHKIHSGSMFDYNFSCAILFGLIRFQLIGWWVYQCEYKRNMHHIKIVPLIPQILIPNRNYHHTAYATLSKRDHKSEYSFYNN